MEHSKKQHEREAKDNKKKKRVDKEALELSKERKTCQLKTNEIVRK